MASTTEQFVLDGLNLNSAAGTYVLLSVDMTPPKKRQEWLTGADQDGSLLLRDPLFENRQIKARIRVNTTGTMDQALAAINGISNKLEEAEKQPNGLPLAWTPAGSVNTITFYVLSGAIDTLPITKKGDDRGWFRNYPVFEVTFDCKPFGYGQTVQTILDDFSTDTITASPKYTFDTGSGTLSVSGGQLVPSSTAEKRLYRSGEGLTYCDAQMTVQVVTGASVASGSTQIIETRLDANNYIRAGVNFAGAASTLTIEKVVAGVGTTLATSAAFTTTAATTYWVRFRAEKNLLTCELWTSAPTPTGSAAQSVTYTLAGADATTLGAGIGGQVGMRLIPVGSDYRFNDFTIEPNIFQTTSPVITAAIPNVQGDVPAEARLIDTDSASQNRKHIEWGLEQRYYSPGLPRILDQFTTDTITSGAWAFDAGAGTLTVSGGQLVPSDTTDKRLYRTDAVYTDSRMVVKMTTGASVASGSLNLVARRIDGSNYLTARLNIGGAASSCSFQKTVAAATSGIGGNGSSFTLAAATSYWLEFVVQGRNLTMATYTTDPATGTAVPITNSSRSYTLSDAEYAQFVSGQNGLRLIAPAGTDYRYDDFRIGPLTGWTDLLIDSEDLISSGFGGIPTTRAGAYTGGTVANHVIRGTLTTSALAVCGTGNLAHVGTFRVKARMYASTGDRTTTFVRLSWKEGDGPLRSNDWVNPPLSFTSFTEVDLGLISIPEKTLGTQRWTGQIEAYSTTGGDQFDIDYIVLIPAGEGYGKARAPFRFQTPSALSASDGFDQAAGNLNAKALPIGGNWATSGDVTDLAVETVGHTAQRTTTSDATGQISRIALAGTTTYTGVVAQVDVKRSSGGTPNVYQGVLARYVDLNNYVAGLLHPIESGVSSTSTLVVAAVVGGVGVVVKTIVIPSPAAGTFYSLRLVVTAGGDIKFAYFPTGTEPVGWNFEASNSALATGGGLPSGKVGFSDANSAASACTRNYDNFWAATLPEDAVVFSGRAGEIRYDSAIRQDSTGTYYGPVNSYRGSRFFLPPAGSAARTSRILVKTRRNDIDAAADDQIADSTTMQVAYTPRYIAVPH